MKKPALSNPRKYLDKWLQRPDLVNAWDMEKNPHFSDISPHSKEKFHWKCDQAHDHRWLATVAGRFSGGRLICPYCPGADGQLPSSTYNFGLLYPELLREWDFEKNNEKSPYEIGPNQRIKVHWVCHKDPRHKWEATVSNRVRHNRGCPCCSGHKVIEGVNSLAALRQDLAEEWHPTKNDKLTAEMVSVSARRSVYWRCSKNNRHEWKAAIYSRFNGTGCPHCSNRAVSEDNSLANVNPEILLDWDYSRNKGIDPKKILSSSSKVVWWKCKRDPEHRWKVRVRNRTVNGTGCPFCRGSTSAQEIRLYCELKALFSDAESRFKVDGKEADIYLPSLSVAVEYDGAYWHKDKFESDLAKNTAFSEVGIKTVRLRCRPLHKIEPTDVSVGDELTKSDVNSVLESIFGSDMPASVANYLQKSVFIAETDFQKYLSYLPSPFPEKSFKNTFPAIAKSWDYKLNYPLGPENFTPFSKKKMWWKCEEGHSWKATVSDRSSGQGCPFCAGKSTLPEDYLRCKHPEIFSELIEVKANTRSASKSNISYRSAKSCLWKCKECYTTFVASPRDRSSSAKKCPKCFPDQRSVRIAKSESRSVKSVPRDFSRTVERDLPDLAAEWHPSKNFPLSPADITTGSSQKYWWQCPKSSTHEWQASVNNRAKGRGCPICSNKLVSDENSLSTTHPEIAKQWDFEKNGSLTPDLVVATSAKKVWWRCKEADDHFWKTEVRVRVEANSCPFCSGRRLSKTNSLRALRPDVAKEWHPELNAPLTPDDVIVGSTKRAWWICSKNARHVWQTAIEKRGKGNRGCPYCARKTPNIKPEIN